MASLAPRCCPESHPSFVHWRARRRRRARASLRQFFEEYSSLTSYGLVGGRQIPASGPEPSLISDGRSRSEIDLGRGRRRSSLFILSFGGSSVRSCTKARLSAPMPPAAVAALAPLPIAPALS